MFNMKKKNTELEEEFIDLDGIDDLEELELDIIDLDKEKVEEKEFSWVREIISTAVYLLAVVAVTFLFVQFVGQRTHVNGDSMNVTLEDGDNLIVDKLSYRFSEPERYDIIVFPYQYQEKTYYIKRIIGMPGETVQIIDGMVYIDGEMLDESYGKEVMQYSGVASDPIELGNDEYFVLGDNRNNSSDSRDPSVGNIKEDQIIGKAFIRIWPLNKFGILKHQ
jgi:signal peptidase I